MCFLLTLKDIVIDPQTAALAAAVLLGRPDLADDVQAIGHRESRYAVFGAHKRDAHLSDKGWYGQVKLGRLKPWCQKRDAYGGWATHGAYGLSAASHWAYMPPCYQPWFFDVPLVSAWVAVQSYEKNCWPTRNQALRRWCRVPANVTWNNATSYVPSDNLSS